MPHGPGGHARRPRVQRVHSVRERHARARRERRVRPVRPVSDDARSGHARQVVQVCEQNCSGHGRCVDGLCLCRAGYLGDACNRVIGICPRNCTGHGACDERTATCACDPGFTGDDCSRLSLQQSRCTGPACSRCPGRTTSPDGGSVPACGNASRTIADVPGAHVDGTTINTVWGGHSARDDDGSWHFFGSAIMDGGSLSRWTD